MTTQVAVMLDQLEAALKASGAWSLTTPMAESLASTMPFCTDTLRFEQWLQFVFIQRFRLMIENNLPLPTNFSVAPAAEMLLKMTEPDYSKIVELLQQLDNLLTNNTLTENS